jgi:hypothetical protein
MTPAELTVATLVELDDHVTVRPVSELPFASIGVATAVAVPNATLSVTPMSRLVDGDVTATLATAVTPGGGPVTSLPPPQPMAAMAAMAIALRRENPCTKFVNLATVSCIGIGRFVRVMS